MNRLDAHGSPHASMQSGITQPESDEYLSGDESLVGDHNGDGPRKRQRPLSVS